jgi:hypothetical protein
MDLFLTTSSAFIFIGYFMVAMMLMYVSIIIDIRDYKDAKASTSNAYGAMAMFLFTFWVSVTYSYLIFVQEDALTSSDDRGADRIRRRRRSTGQEYELVEISNNTPLVGLSTVSGKGRTTTN